MRSPSYCPCCDQALATPEEGLDAECGACGWFEGMDDDDDIDDGGAFQEARHMAGMGGGNAGLADFGGLELDGPDNYDDNY